MTTDRKQMNDKPNRYARILRTAAALLLFGGMFSRCASTMTPQGGPKDTIPPSSC